MRRVSILLLAGFQLGLARQPGFSIHDDLLAHPQFEIIFSDAYISEHDAQTLFELGAKPNSASGTDVEAPSHGASAPSGNDDEGLEREVSETYELMNVPPHKYLCAIPVVAPPPAPNLTETELAKAEEAREVARATAAGWQLLRDLDGKCLYFVSGWWSYQFCFGEEVVQFHALPANNKGGPPVRDSSLQEYVLGRHDDSTVPTPGDSRSPAAAGELESVPRNTELAVKGDQRYLMQRLEDGTVCDLTNRPRTIEIQYHCAPQGTTDRIGWIKEITTCSYLMVVYTPRLCRDVAFLPPKETRAHAISCREILNHDQEQAWHAKKTLELTAAAAQAMAKKQAKARGGGKAVIGGVEVGGRRGRSNKESGRAIILATGKSREAGGEETALSDEEVTKLNLDPTFVKQMREEVIRAAQGHPWQLEMVDDPVHGPELRGIFLTDEEEGEEEGKGGSTEQTKDEKMPERPLGGGSTGKQVRQPKTQEKDYQQERQTGVAPNEEEAEQGSEEKFYVDRHDEL